MDEIRYPERDPKLVGENFHFATFEQIASAERLVDALALPEDFSTTNLPNPHLQRHFEIIEVVPFLFTKILLFPFRRLD